MQQVYWMTMTLNTFHRVSQALISRENTEMTFTSRLASVLSGGPWFSDRVQCNVNAMGAQARQAMHTEFHSSALPTDFRTVSGWSGSRLFPQNNFVYRLSMYNLYCIRKGWYRTSDIRLFCWEKNILNPSRGLQAIWGQFRKEKLPGENSLFYNFDVWPPAIMNSVSTV